MEKIRLVNYIITILFMCCYAYQFIYIFIALFKKKKVEYIDNRKHKFAILICARNEEKVIGELIDSINKQIYDHSLITTFVMADNCTDNTCLFASRKGAKVYTRNNYDNVGKGYALQELLRNIKTDYGDIYDGYIVVDADNILSKDYITKMNDSFNEGYDVITSYRNSKNYDSNWLSAGYALWYLRESKFLNEARYKLNTSCMVSGTGFMFSRNILNKMGDWPYHCLVEDIEFSAAKICEGVKIGYSEAMLYDEQPIKFKQSYYQRLRWCKGILQVFYLYGKDLFKRIIKLDFSSYDMCMCTMPAYILSILSLIMNVVLTIMEICEGNGILASLFSIGELLIDGYLTLYVIGLITTISEWKNIDAKVHLKILYTLTFPLFIYTYIPISFLAIFKKCEWIPTTHNISMNKKRKLV